MDLSKKGAGQKVLGTVRAGGGPVGPADPPLPGAGLSSHSQLLVSSVSPTQARQRGQLEVEGKEVPCSFAYHES